MRACVQRSPRAARERIKLRASSWAVLAGAGLVLHCSVYESPEKSQGVAGTVSASGTASPGSAGTVDSGGAPGNTGGGGTSALGGSAGVGGAGAVGGAGVDAGGGGGAAGQDAVGGAPADGVALAFDGTQLLQLPIAPRDDFTIEMWIKTSMLGTGTNWYQGGFLLNADLAGVANDFGLSLLEGHVAFGTGNPDVTILSTSLVNTDEWVHVAATRKRSSGTVSIIVNGSLETQMATGNTGGLNDAQPPSVGALYTDKLYGGYTGSIDEIRLWTIARSPEQIVASMHTRLVGNEANLIAYYRLEEGEGLIAKDSSGSKGDAVLGGGHAGLEPTWSTYSPALP